MTRKNNREPWSQYCRFIFFLIKVQVYLNIWLYSVQFSSVQWLSHVWLFATPWITARQASLSITNSWSSFKLMSIESVMPSSHLILCRPLLLLPSIPPSIRVFSNESTLRVRWPKYWSFSFSIIPFKEHHSFQRLISFRMDWLDLLAVQGTLILFPVILKIKKWKQNYNWLSWNSIHLLFLPLLSKRKALWKVSCIFLHPNISMFINRYDFPKQYITALYVFNINYIILFQSISIFSSPTFCFGKVSTLIPKDVAHPFNISVNQCYFV